MTTTKKTLTPNEWSALLLGASLLFGFVLRISPGLQAGFPLNDGGMFLSMIRDLKVSHYQLPAFTSYNDLGIPYAYPPFGFYLARLLCDIFNLTEITILRWLPPLVNSLSIFVFYNVAAVLLNSPGRGALAAAFYALTPAAFGWFIMGGGLTRSLGSLFMLLSILWVYRLFQDGGKKAVALSILFCALTVLSHPEAGIHTALACALLWLFFGRTRSSLLKAILVGAGTILFSSPWWLTVISHHGLSPFLSAMQTGSHGTPLLAALYNAIFTSESFVPFLVILRAVGIGWAFWKKNYFLLLWAVLPFIAEPRSAPSAAFYPLCMLTALALADAIPAILDQLRRIKITEEFHQRRWLNAALTVILIYLFIESGIYGFKLVNNSLSLADLQTMEWVQQNTPATSRFLALTGVRSPEIDPFVEWFPALTDRRNQSTLQGYEWLLGSGFYERYADLAELQACNSAECIGHWAERTGLGYEYVVVQRSSQDEALIASFDGAENYRMVYFSEGAIIYQVRK
ncbi:MAG: hypothetical protein HY864_08435 [Chloroflexi bacterium]|nr:hypothetical protein [Chloroflexota bacterium]